MAAGRFRLHAAFGPTKPTHNFVLFLALRLMAIYTKITLSQYTAAALPPDSELPTHKPPWQHSSQAHRILSPRPRVSAGGWSKGTMGTDDAATCRTVFCTLLLLTLSCDCLAADLDLAQTAVLEVNTSWVAARKIPQTLFGLFFEEINHAGAGGIWAELISNRGFEAGGLNTPSNIDPWSIIGDESSIYVQTERASCFSKNIIALRMEVHCDECPAGNVGIYNPGFWGMGHGFRKELIHMLMDLRPQFLRFPGGCFVEGDWLRNAFRWRETIGPWEERPGHYGDVWKYWTDDGLGYYEFLQLSEDLGAEPIWVFNAGISHHDEVDTTTLAPFVEEIISCFTMQFERPIQIFKLFQTVMAHLSHFTILLIYMIFMSIAMPLLFFS
ncbi:hypothetical protein ACQ4PT_025770 [Festuca glaucescens]